MRWEAALAAIALLVHPALAALGHDANKTDWHTALIGHPRIRKGSGPAFHRVPPALPGKPWKSVIFVETSANVLAGINPGDGKLGQSESPKPP